MQNKRGSHAPSIFDWRKWNVMEENGVRHKPNWGKKLCSFTKIKNFFLQLFLYELSSLQNLPLVRNASDPPPILIPAVKQLITTSTVIYRKFKPLNLHHWHTMQKTAQKWFTDGRSNDLDRSSSSLLADWNAYAASKSDGAESSSLGFDLEAAVRTANDKVSGTFNV